jgi:hypothetical protein
MGLRWALYSPYSSWRTVGPLTSKTTPRYSGFSASRSLRRALAKPKMAPVGKPDELDRLRTA